MMKKLLYNAIWLGSALIFGAANTVFAAAANETSDVQAIAGNKVYIYADLSEQDETDAIMTSLEMGGLVGQFVISASDMRTYPDYVTRIVERGHLVVIKAQKDAANAVQQAPKQQKVNRPARTQNYTKPAAETPAKTTVVRQAEDVVKSSTTNEARVVEPTQPKLESVNWSRPQNGNYTERQMRDRLAVADASRMSRKEYIERDFLMPTGKGKNAYTKKPGPAKAADDVPDWSLVSLSKLSEYGLLSPDEVQKILSEPTRELMAQLVTRAYHNLGLVNDSLGDKKYDADFEVQKLIHEYDTELRNLGYGAGSYTAYKKLPRETGLKIGGELRYNYVDHRGSKTVRRSYKDSTDDYTDFDSRLRARIYADKSLDGNWALHGMLEAEKSWYHKDKNGKPKLERVYIDGMYKDIFWTGGRFAELYGDGNIYDGEFTGVRAQTTKGRVKYTAEIGRLRDHETGGAIMADYTEPAYDLSAGLYRFSDIKSYNPKYGGRDLWVMSLGGMRYYGNLGLGAMFVGSNRRDVNDQRYGYILTARFGRNRSWVPGSFEFFAHYYNQPDTTYFGHTMVGLADSMEGFKGYNVGFYFTLAENVVYSFEYYDLHNKYDNSNARTLWNHVAYYF